MAEFSESLLEKPIYPSADSPAGILPRGEILAFIINHEDARMLADSTLKGSTRDKHREG